MTIGEMTKWAELRDWGPRNRERLELWLAAQVHLEYDITVAQTWGRLSAAGQRRGRSTPIKQWPCGTGTAASSSPTNAALCRLNARRGWFVPGSELRSRERFWTSGFAWASIVHVGQAGGVRFKLQVVIRTVRNNKRVSTVLLALAAFVLVLGVIAFYLGPFAWLIAGNTVRGIADPNNRSTAINAVRQTLLAAAAGIAAVAGLSFTARTYQLSRRGQLTDRFAKAIGQLASEKIEERLGAIYALDHVLRESPQDHETVVKMLTAFIRKAAPLPEDRSTLPAAPERILRRDTYGMYAHPKSDVQAALTVIAQRPVRDEREPLILSATDLRGASLGGARLDKAYLTDSNLQGAYMVGASLSETVLARADLRGTNLKRANLERADVKGALCKGAALKGANICGASFAQAEGLEPWQISAAIRDSDTKLPGYVLPRLND